MNRRVIVLMGALVLLLLAGTYDASIAAKIVAARKAKAAMAQQLSEIEGPIRFQGRPDAGFEQRAMARAGSEQPARAATFPKGKHLPTPKMLIAGDPTLRAKYLASYRDGLDQQYGLYIRMLGLTAAQAAQFKDLMAQREANSLQVAEAAADSGMDTDDPEMKALSNQLNQQNWQQLKALLGPTGTAELKQYWNQWPIVTLVQNFGGTLPTADLTITQAQDLLPVLSAASQRNSSGTVIPDTINVTQAVSAAAPILSPSQLLTLSATLQEMEAKARIKALSGGQ